MGQKGCGSIPGQTSQGKLIDMTGPKGYPFFQFEPAFSVSNGKGVIRNCLSCQFLLNILRKELSVWESTEGKIRMANLMAHGSSSILTR